MSLDLSSTTLDLIKAVNDALNSKLSLSGGTLTGALTTKDLTLKGIEQFQTHYAKKLIGTLSAGTSYANLDSKYKDGTYHRMWRLRFPASCNFWGKIKITLYGGYSSFNASGIMSKSITCNFNGSSIYNNVGFYDGLGVNVEKDFRISEAIWNSTASAWEILIWQKNLNGNNSPTILFEAWSSGETYLTNAKNITAQAVELTQATTYTASKASSTGGTKTVNWATTPVYETPLGEEIATMSDIPSVSVTQKLTSGTEIGSITVGTTTTRLYAPTGSDNYLPLSGGTLTGDIKFNTVTPEDIKKIGTENGKAYIEVEGGDGSLDLGAFDSISLDSTSVYIDGDQGGSSLSLDGRGITINADETINGNITLSAKQGVISATAPANVSGQEKVTAWFNTANGGRVGFGKEAANSGTGIFFDQVSGTRRLNFRASATAGAMVWEQPESGSCLYYDVGGIQFRGCSSLMFNQFKSAGYLYTDSSGYLKKGTMPTSLKNPNALTFGSKTYDGSSAQTITASDIGAELSGAASNALASAKSYADTAIANLVNSAPETLNTLGELATAIQAHEDEYDALLKTVGSKVKKTTQTATVIGTSKTTEAIGEYQLVFPKGAVFSGTAASAGLVTRGICGVTTPDANGSCNKENLYINYDGTNDYNAGRQLVLQAGAVGTHYGNNLYQYCAARGDAVKGYVDANTIKSLSVSGTTITYTKGDGSTGTITTQDQYVKNTHTAVNRQASLALLPNNTSSEGTSKVYKNTSLYANPGTGGLYATSFYENNTALSEKYHPKKRKVTLAELRTAMQTMTTGTRIQVVPYYIDDDLLYSVGSCIAYSSTYGYAYNSQTKNYYQGTDIYCVCWELEISDRSAEARYLSYHTNGSQLTIDDEVTENLTDSSTDFYILD